MAARIPMIFVCSNSPANLATECAAAGRPTRRMGQASRGTLSRDRADGGLHGLTWRKWPRSPSRTGELKVHKITCVVDCGQMVIRESSNRKSKGHRLWSVRRPVGRGDHRRRPGAADQFQQLSAAAQQRVTRTRCASRGQRRDPGGIGEPPCRWSPLLFATRYFAATRKRLRELPIGTQKLVKA